MNTLDMYKIAENEKIDILNYKWSNTKARIFEIIKALFYASSLEGNSLDEAELLIHEFYNTKVGAN